MTESEYEVKEKLKTKANNAVWVRLQLSKNTHRKIKSFNLTQPRERLDQTMAKLIERGLESVTRNP